MQEVMQRYTRPDGSVDIDHPDLWDEMVQVVYDLLAEHIGDEHVFELEGSCVSCTTCDRRIGSRPLVEEAAHRLMVEGRAPRHDEPEHDRPSTPREAQP